MKISKTEKILLMVLAALLIGVGYNNFIFSYERDKITELTNTKTSSQAKLDSINQQIAVATKREKDVKILNSKVQDTAANIYPVIEQERMILELDNLLAVSKVDGSFSFSAVAANQTQANSTTSNTASSGTSNGTANSSSSATNKKTDNTATALTSMKTIANQYNLLLNSQKNTTSNSGTTTTTNQTTASKGQLDSIRATVTFSGTYSNVIAFIKNIENNNKRIVISSLSISGGNSSQVSGTVVLDFYAVPKLGDSDADYLKWKFNNQYGKDNPFVVGSGANVNTTIEQASVPKTEANDFVMSVMSVNSDLPTIMMGKANDTERKSYIYEDTDKVENIEITLTENAGKFYYKYKAGNITYPNGYNGNGIEFTPSSTDIIITINSSQRVSSADNSGAKINIINNTSKAVKANIKSDDSKRPRISVTGSGGALSVYNQ